MSVSVIKIKSAPHRWSVLSPTKDADADLDDEGDGAERHDDEEEKEENDDDENGGRSDEENDDEKQGAAMTYAGAADDVAGGAVPLATLDNRSA